MLISRKQVLKAFNFASNSQLYFQQSSLLFDDFCEGPLIFPKWTFPYNNCYFLFFDSC